MRAARRSSHRSPVGEAAVQASKLPEVLATGAFAEKVFLVFSSTIETLFFLLFFSSEGACL